jgi:hypothetical protein
VSKREIGSRQEDSSLESKLERLRREYRGLFGVEPSRETLLKIATLQDLIRRGLSLRESIRRVRLGWKNYYKYAPLVYSDPEVLIPVSEKYLNYYTRPTIGITSELLWQLRLVLNGVAWQGAWDIILPKLAEGKIRGGEAGRE